MGFRELPTSLSQYFGMELKHVWCKGVAFPPANCLPKIRFMARYRSAHPLPLTTPNRTPATICTAKAAFPNTPIFGGRCRPQWSLPCRDDRSKTPWRAEIPEKESGGDCCSGGPSLPACCCHLTPRAGERVLKENKITHFLQGNCFCR